jgi:hypothetical protein
MAKIGIEMSIVKIMKLAIGGYNRQSKENNEGGARERKLGKRKIGESYHNISGESGSEKRAAKKSAAA